MIASAVLVLAGVYGNLEVVLSAPGPDARICLDESCRAPDDLGRALWTGLEVSWEGRSMLVRVEAKTGGPRWEGVIHVPPGASASPRLVCTEVGQHLLCTPDSAMVGPFRDPAPVPLARVLAGHGPRFVVFATRIGLVGRTTANGHVILPRDTFVALPSRRALSPSNTRPETVVELRRGDRVVRVPVWDVGPWNVRDDWWNPPWLREMAPELPRGMPQAAAAFHEGFMDGLDGFGRRVSNPAGIDLADGTFWDSMGLLDNGEVEVRMTWLREEPAGTRVRSRQDHNVRAAPGGALVHRSLCSSMGVLVGDSLRGAMVGSWWYGFREVIWDDGIRGWSATNFLALGTDSVFCAQESGVPDKRTRDRSRGMVSQAGNSIVFDLADGGAVRWWQMRADGTVKADGRLRLDPGRSRWIPPAGGGFLVVQLPDGERRVVLLLPSW